MEKCIFYHWSEDAPHAGDCIMGDYQPRDAKEAQYGIDQTSKGFSKGYYKGLKEGYATAHYPERCHCCHCHSHGELCWSPH